MKWCRFQSGQKVSYGVIEGSTVTEVTGSPFESHTRTSTTLALSRVKLLVPVIPPTFYAAGVNYQGARDRDGAAPRRQARVPAPGRCRLPGQQRAGRDRRADRHPAGRDGAGPVRGRAGGGDR